MDSSTQIEEAAAAWLARRDAAPFSATERQEFEAWVEGSIANRLAYLRLEAVWQSANRLQALGAGAQVMPASQLPVRRFRYRAVAAALLGAAVLLGAGLSFRPVPAPVYDTVVGGIESVPLTDGSQVTLNTNSEIHLAVTDRERGILLERGEAFFDVAKDPKRPFVVHVGDHRVIAVGTRFSVRRDGDEATVVVLDGRVRIEQPQAVRRPPAQLVAGNIARTAEGGVIVAAKPLAEASRYLSWRSGYLVFEDTPLSAAVAEFNRYNTRQIIIGDPEVASIHIGGNFGSRNIDAFVRLMEQGAAIRAHPRGNDVVLTKP